MEHSVQGCFLPSNTCKYCGAGAHNSYQHDENCLINVPVDKMPPWRLGWRQRLGGMITAAGGKSYQMGARLAEKKLRAEFPGHSATENPA